MRESWKRHSITVGAWQCPGGWRFSTQVIIKSMTHTHELEFVFKDIEEKEKEIHFLPLSPLLSLKV
jgi:hypothetical protein